MLNNIPIKKRLVGILILQGIAVILIFLYFSQARRLSRELSGLRSKTAQLATADTDMALQQKTLIKLDDDIQALQQKSVQVRTHIQFSDYLEAICLKNKVRLVALPLENKQQQDDYSIANITFSLQGNFHDIISVLYQLEQKDHVASVSYLKLTRKQVRMQSARRNILVAEVTVNRLLNTKDKNS